MKVLIILLILLLYMLAVMPNLRGRSRMKPFLGVFFAHRGLHNKNAGVPENSLAAFRLAVSHGYGIELDVQLTRDDVVVVFHDAGLSRMCGIDTKVIDHTYEQLKRRTLLDTSEYIPTFAEVLALVDGKIPLLIEIKSISANTRICRKVAELLQDYQGSFCVESFNPISIHWFKTHCPHIVRGQLASNLTRTSFGLDIIPGFIVKYLLSNFYARPDFIAYRHSDSSNVSLTVNRLLYKIPTLAWTVKSEKIYETSRKRFEGWIFEDFLP